MNTLKIPYVKQVGDLTCGPACLQMVYNYYGIENLSQQDIYYKYKTEDPHDSKAARVLTDDLVSDARSRGFKSAIMKVDVSNISESVDLMNIFLDASIPIIVCQQYSLALPLTGHFRVVIGIDDQNIYFHDPGNKIENGESLKLSHEEFFKLWQATGENVTGGIFVWIKK